MKHIHLSVALLLAALLALGAPCALAATVKTDEVPKLTFEAPQEPVSAGASVTILVTPTLPGFLTLRLTDAYGGEVVELFKSKELHTKENEVSFFLRDADGAALPGGAYTLVGSMNTQYGVSSETVSVPLTVQSAMSPDDPDPLAGTAAAATGAYNPAGATGATGTTGTTGTGLPAPAPAGSGAYDPTSAYSPTAAYDPSGAYDPASAYDPTGAYNPSGSSLPASTGSTPIAVATEVVTYMQGSGVPGDEGLLIGVGVSDVAQQPDAGYWNLTASSSDEEIWAALTRNMVSANVDEKESAYIYDSVNEGRKKLGTVSGLSQGLNVVFERSDGWSLVEAYRNEDGAFVRGYMRSNRLRVVEPNQLYGLVVDKASQTLTVYQNGQRVGSCSVSTGLPTVEYLQRETPAGEFITVTRRGTTEYGSRGFNHYTVRINGNYHLCEVPTTTKNGSDFSLLEGSLGAKASRGNIVVQHAASTDGGINAKWIWDMTDNNKKVKVLVFDDKPRSNVPVGK